MGLTSWKHSPDGKIIKTDVSIAKNYLSKEELKSLGRIVSAYLDLAEERAQRNIPMTMEDWAKRLDSFLEFDEREILQKCWKNHSKKLLKNMLNLNLRNIGLSKISYFSLILINSAESY